MSDYTHFFFAAESQGYWPASYQTDHEPTAMLAFKATEADDSPVLFGGRDGYIRRHSHGTSTDDGSTISSYVKIGPVRCGGDVWNKGAVRELAAAMAEGSGNVTWELYVAETADATLDLSTAHASGLWMAGLSNTSRPRRGGGAFLLKVRSREGQNPWAMEWIKVKTARKGRQRA